MYQLLNITEMLNFDHHLFFRYVANRCKYSTTNWSLCQSRISMSKQKDSYAICIVHKTLGKLIDIFLNTLCYITNDFFQTKCCIVEWRVNIYILPSCYICLNVQEMKFSKSLNKTMKQIFIQVAVNTSYDLLNV